MLRILSLFLVWLALASPALAAEAIDSQESSATAHSSTTSPLTWSFTNTAGTTLFVGVVVTTNSTAVTIGTPTYNGVSMTAVPSSLVTWDTAHSAAQWFYLNSPATGTHTVSVPGSWTGSPTVHDILGAAISFTGANSTTPYVAAFTNSTGSSNTTATVNATGTTNGNYIISIAGAGSAFSAAVSPTVLSAELNVSGLTGGNNLVLGEQSSAGGTVTASFTLSIDIWGISAVEVKPPSAVGGGHHTLPLVGAWLVPELEDGANR